MSLREEWYAARVQRQQEVRERQQQVLEYRQQIQAEMAALHQYQRTMLSNFHSTLQADVATFLEKTRCSLGEPRKARSHQQQVWLEQQYQRAADFVAALQDYVWGTTPTPGNSRIATPTNLMQGS